MTAIRPRYALVLCVLLSVLTTTMATQAKKHPPAKPLDLNSATAAQLEQLPGVGPATAKAIVQFREKSGPFRRVEDLLAVPRITKKRLEKLRPYVTVSSSGKKRP